MGGSRPINYLKYCTKYLVPTTINITFNLCLLLPLVANLGLFLISQATGLNKPQRRHGYVVDGIRLWQWDSKHPNLKIKRSGGELLSL